MGLARLRMIKELHFARVAPVVATPEDVAALEKRLGVALPPALVEFCSRWNGGFTSKENDFYPVPRSFEEYYNEYKNSFGVPIVVLFGATKEFWHCNLLEEWTESDAGIPISIDSFGNRAVLRPDSPNGPVYWHDHELWEMPEIADPDSTADPRPRLIPIAPDLEYFYNALTFDPHRKRK